MRWQRFSPGQVFILFVMWCMLGVIGTVATLLFFPWSIPFALAAIVVGQLCRGPHPDWSRPKLERYR